MAHKSVTFRRHDFNEDIWMQCTLTTPGHSKITIPVHVVINNLNFQKLAENTIQLHVKVHILF